MLTLDDIIAFSKSVFTYIRGSHDWDHTQRVYNLCMHIGRIEKADMDVLKVAAYLHDVGRPFQEQSNGAICHAEKGAEIAADLLREYPIPDKQKANIIHCIRTHRFRGKNRPETLEAKILFDSDKLDAIGAIGIGRTFQFAGEIGAKLHNPLINPEVTSPYTEEDTGYREYQLKLSKIKDRIITNEGKRIAKGRHAFMVAFFKRFISEYQCSL
jgi:uncharacterized protein